MIGTSLRFYAKWRPRQVLTPANDWIGQQLLTPTTTSNLQINLPAARQGSIRWPWRPKDGSSVKKTYLQVKGAGIYRYRAVDQAGKTVDFHVSRHREVAAAKAFLRKAMRQPRPPIKITLDAYAASQRAVADRKKRPSSGRSALGCEAIST